MLSPQPVQFPEWLGDLAARGAPVRALVAGGHSRHVLEGVRLAAEAGWLEPVLVGPRREMLALAESIGWDIESVEQVDADGEGAIAKASTVLAADPACGMVVKGHVHTNVLLSSLLRREARIRIGRPLLHVWFMTNPEFDRPIAISDGAFNIMPDFETRKAIVEALAGMFAAIGRPRPRIALLAASEEVLEAMPTTEEAARVATWAHETEIDAEVFGPVAMDAAISPEAAGIKSMPPPAGFADALVVPSIEVGNVLAKTLIWFRSACAAGVVLGGRIPIALTSRSDAPEARLAAVALARVLTATGRHAGDA